jgi:putative FmdB family regulatory protein
MPTYQYRCRRGHTFELFHSIRDDSVKKCPRCGARARRVPAGGAGLLFKGSGFYITDYRSKSYRETAKREQSHGGEAPKSPEAGAGGTGAPPKGGAKGGKAKGEKATGHGGGPPAGGKAGGAKPRPAGQ